MTPLRNTGFSPQRTSPEIEKPLPLLPDSSSPCPDCTMFNYRDGADQAPQAQSGAAGGQGNKRARTAAMYQRKRAVTACQSCRLRKTKCDNVRPACGFCSKNGAQCIYPGPETSDYSTSVFLDSYQKWLRFADTHKQFRPGQLDYPRPPQPCCHTLGVSTPSSHHSALRCLTAGLGGYHVSQLPDFYCSYY